MRYGIKEKVYTKISIILVNESKITLVIPTSMSFIDDNLILYTLAGHIQEVKRIKDEWSVYVNADIKGYLHRMLSMKSHELPKDLRDAFEKDCSDANACVQLAKIITQENKLKIDSIDNGFCRINYIATTKVGRYKFCIHDEGTCKCYRSSPDWEPDTEVLCIKGRWEIPMGDSTIEKSVRKFLLEEDTNG